MKIIRLFNWRDLFFIFFGMCILNFEINSTTNYQFYLSTVSIFGVYIVNTHFGIFSSCEKNEKVLEKALNQNPNRRKIAHV